MVTAHPKKKSKSKSCLHLGALIINRAAGACTFMSSVLPLLPLAPPSSCLGTSTATASWDSPGRTWAIHCKGSGSCPECPCPQPACSSVLCLWLWLYWLSKVTSQTGHWENGSKTLVVTPGRDCSQGRSLEYPDGLTQEWALVISFCSKGNEQPNCHVKNWIVLRLRGTLKQTTCMLCHF